MNPYLNPRPAHSQESIKGNRVTPYALLDTDAPPGHAPATGTSGNQNQNVYVVHADGGGEDLHIQLPTPGARVIEMPPQYRGGDGPGPGPGPASAGSTPGTPGGGGGNGKRPRMGLSLSSGSQNEETRALGPPVSPVMSQVTSEKSRQ
jgi:hypothetical protein